MRPAPQPQSPHPRKALDRVASPFRHCEEDRRRDPNYNARWGGRAIEARRERSTTISARSNHALSPTLRRLPLATATVDFPTNGGHPVKSVNSTEEVHHGKNPTHLHPGVQG